MGIKGLKHWPSTSIGGLKVVSTAYAIVHNKYFVIAKKTCKSGHSHYVVETMTKAGKAAKRQVRELWDTDFDSQGDAKAAIRRWDLI